MDFKAIKELVNMRRLLTSYGVEPDKTGRCACPIHGGDNKTAFSISNDLQTWNCHTKCGCGGDIFTFVEKKESCTNAQAKVSIMQRFAISEGEPIEKPKTVSEEHSRNVYVYRSADGAELYRINRVNFKDGSKKCFPEYQGKATLPKEVRTLYNLDKINGTDDFVFICEGEKTADAVTECGFIGTTNPLGSSNWDASYASLLAGKKVVIMPDADECGEKWRDAVLESLAGKVEQAQIISIPEKFIAKHPEYKGHDFADMVESYNHEKATEWLQKKLDSTKVLPKGVDTTLLGLPLDGFRELQRKAKNGIRTDVFNFCQWLPTLDLEVNEGDCVVLIAGTGVGKTRLLHNIPYRINNINYAMFDLELSYNTLCERYGAMVNGISVRSLKEKMRHGFSLIEPNIDNVFLQKVEGLTVQKIKDRVNQLEQITQKRIHAVSVDYIGLMGGFGSAYEKTSSNVEDFKAWISATNRVGLLTSQITRPEDKDNGIFQCPNPFSAKNSGSIENSAQELLAFWRPSDDKRAMKCKCWKYTHGEYPFQEINLIADDLVIYEDNR
jgi:5S rRNA maturation endonuclease (ribonuclease M5)